MKDTSALPSTDITPTNGGGPAFPNENRYTENKNNNGLTKRDYFAAAALQGLYAGREGCVQSECFNLDAELAYKAADAMIAERNKCK